MRCAAEGISVYTPHSALDATWGGVNDWIAQGISGSEEGISTTAKITVLAEEKLDRNGVSEGGDGRLVTFKDTISRELLHQLVKGCLGLGSRKYCPSFDPTTALNILYSSSDSRRAREV